MMSSNGTIFRVIGPLWGEFPAQRAVTRSFDVSLDLRLNKRLRKQSWDWWFETPSRWLWRHRNEYVNSYERLHYFLTKLKFHFPQHNRPVFILQWIVYFFLFNHIIDLLISKVPVSLIILHPFYNFM